MEIRTLPLDHLGLVSGVFDQLDIADLIDDRLPKKRNHNLEHSKLMKAMVLNGLGYVGQRLYLFPEFYEKLPVERLLGEGVTAADLNDDALGRSDGTLQRYSSEGHEPAGSRSSTASCRYYELQRPGKLRGTKRSKRYRNNSWPFERRPDGPETVRSRIGDKPRRHTSFCQGPFGQCVR